MVKAEGYSMLFGEILEGEKTVDEVMVGIFRAPKSYTGEDIAEISCHGSVFIQDKILKLLLKNGARLAEAGEFTMRAFANGKMDLSQAEAVADLIASESRAAHQTALSQMRGGFSSELKELREELIEFASLIELELDFGEEDVEFADRQKLDSLLQKIKRHVKRLIESFDTGSAIKDGVPVAIVGAPNVGKSTLLNALLNEEKAIVTEIAGTTRDAIEDQIILGGVKFRFIDTAGIRETEDVVERLGIRKTWEKIGQARVVVYLFDVSNESTVNSPQATAKRGNPESEDSVLNTEYLNQDTKTEIQLLKEKIGDKDLLILANKMDVENAEEILSKSDLKNEDILKISAKEKMGIEKLIEKLLESVNLNALNSNQTIVTNLRHFEALQNALADLERVEHGLVNQISGDFLAQDIRQALRHLGSIVGEVEIDRDILGAIFGKFCIGK